MILSLKSAPLAAIMALASTAISRPIDESGFGPADIIVRDVAVIGGGASGSYAAVRIKDAGKSVIVIELKDHLGGHVDTYTDPATGASIDFGVQAFMDLPGSKAFFERFNIPIQTVSAAPFLNQYVDFRTGKPVAGYPSADQAAATAALGKYAQIAAQHNDLFFPDYFGLAQLPPGSVPEDLTMPFGEFVQKHEIQAALPFMWTFISGLGDVMNAPTLFVMQNLGAVHIQQLSQGGFFTTAARNNSALYAAVASYLGPEAVLFNSRVAAADRNATGVRLLVKGPGGKQKLVKAKKLLITIPPTKDNMYQFDADAVENALLSKWTWNNLYATIFSGSNLPAGLNIVNTNPDSSPSAFNYPTGRYADILAYTGIDNLYRTMVVGAPDLGVMAAKNVVRDAVKAIGAAGTFPNIKRIDFAAWADHSPSQLRVGSQEIQTGFYAQLYALQGKRSTWFTGSSFTSDYTSILWLFTEAGVLPGLLAGL